MLVYHYSPTSLFSFVNPYNDDFDMDISNLTGDSYEEICDNYITLLSKDVTIGIPHNLDYYTRQFKMVPNKWHQYYFGRLETIVRMINDGVINKNKKHNISELYLPQEIKFYNNINFINSVTTNNAVYNGIMLRKYFVLGLQETDLFNEEINDIEVNENILNSVIHNLDIFDLYIESRNVS